MFIAIRKEPNGKLYMDKEIYLRTNTIKILVEDYERFKKENPNLEHTCEKIQEIVKKEIVLPKLEDYESEPQNTTIEEIVEMMLITTRLFSDEQLSKPPYNYTKIEVEDIYSDCQASDFNEDLTFSPIKYVDRKQREKDEIRIAEIKPRLEQLSQDIVQSLAGAEFEDMAERQKEFQTLHNELRVLLGKMPRNYLDANI